MCFSPSVSRPCGLDSDAETYVFCNRCYAAILGAMAIVDWPELFEPDTQQQQQQQDMTDIHEARDGGDRPSRSQDPTQELQHEHNDPVITNHTTMSPPWLLEQYLNEQFVTFAARILGVPLLVPGSSSPRPAECNRRRSGTSSTSSSRQGQIRSKYRACVAAFIEASLESAQRCGLLDTDGDWGKQHRPRWLVTLPDGGSGSGSSDEAQEETVPESAVHAVEAWFATREWDIGAWNPSPVVAQVGDHVEEGPASQYDNNNHDTGGGGRVEYRHIYVPAPAAVDDSFSQDPRVPQDPRLLEQLQLEKQRCVVRWAEDEDDHDDLL